MLFYSTINQFANVLISILNTTNIIAATAKKGPNGIS